MELGSTLYATLLFVTALVAGAIAAFAWRHRRTAGALELGAVMGAASTWALFAAVEVAVNGPGTKLLFTRFQYVSITVVPVAWVTFAIRYTGRWQLSRRSVAALSVVPLVTTAVALSNPAHGLLWEGAMLTTSTPVVVAATAYGPWFWVHAAYSYVLLAIGTGLLVRSFVLSGRLYRWQAAALVGGCLVPWLANALYITDVVRFGVDPTPSGLTVTGILFAGAVFRNHLFDIVPAAREVARDELVRDMTEGAIVLDARARIVDANRAAEIALGRATPDLVGRSLAAASEPVAAAVTRARTDDRGRADVTLRDERGARQYDVRVSALRRGYGAVTGSLVGLVEVTERRRREQRLDVQNRLLRHNLRNEMNVIQGNAALATAAATDREVVDRLETIEETARTIVERSRKLKRFDREASGDTTDPVRLTSVLEGVCDTVAGRYPNARVTTEFPERKPMVTGSALTIAFEELLANAITHTDRAEPSVFVRVCDGTGARSDGGVDSGSGARTGGIETVSVRIRDDGPGIPTHERRAIEAGEETALQHASGIGLWIVAWIVREAGGEIAFETTEAGSTVTVTLPRAASDPTANAGDTVGDDTRTVDTEPGDTDPEGIDG